MDFTYSAFEEKPVAGSPPTRFLASITVSPSMPCKLSRDWAIAPPGTATSTASASETSPPSRPILRTSWPAFSQRPASPPPTLPLPTTAIFISLLIFVFVVRVQFLDDAQGGRGWLVLLCRPRA